MNDELQQLFIENFQSLKDFTICQLPDVFQQLITWGMINSAWMFVSFAVASVICFKVSMWSRNKYKDMSEHENYEPLVAAQCVLFGLFILFVVLSLDAACDLFKIWLCPKAYLIKAITG